MNKLVALKKKVLEVREYTFLSNYERDSEGTESNLDSDMESILRGSDCEESLNWDFEGKK